MEDVVAEDERDRFVPDEVRPDQERLRDASGAGLRRVLDLQAQLRSVAQQPLEGVPFGGHGDDEDVPHACQYQGGQGVVDHRLVEYRHELFRHDLGDRPQPGAGPAGQDDASHVREAKDAAYSADRGRVGAGLLLWVLRAAGAVRARGPLWCSSGVWGVRGGRLRGGPGPAGRGSALVAGSGRCGTEGEGGGGGRGFCSSPMRRGRMLRLGWLCGTRPAVSRGRGRETTASAERASAALARAGFCSAEAAGTSGAGCVCVCVRVGSGRGVPLTGGDRPGLSVRGDGLRSVAETNEAAAGTSSTSRITPALPRATGRGRAQPL